VERSCDELVAIPQLQADASFNVSVAAALALGETFRQHQIFEKAGK
jgi:tRNA G18 (ribose-2'-O)-methylase SpoU